MSNRQGSGRDELAITSTREGKPVNGEVSKFLAVDGEAYCHAAVILSVLAIELQEKMKEIEINPMKAFANGCIGLDALMVKQ